MLTSDYKLTFGKYCGVPLLNVPQRYLIDFYRSHSQSYEILNSEKKSLVDYILTIVPNNELGIIKEVNITEIINRFCPKEFFVSESDAKYRLNYIHKTVLNGSSRQQSGKIPIRVYKCDRCPYWHLTSMEKHGVVKEELIQDETIEYQGNLKDKWLKLMAD